MQPLVLVLDVGTTGVKAFLFDTTLQEHAKAYITYPIHTLQPGWVEQDPKTILQASIRVIREVVKKSRTSVSRIASMGITNQRETTILWDVKNGKPIYPAIVWQDRRTKTVCAALKRRNGKAIRLLSGLEADPYFSATKIAWILDHVPHARTLADCGRLRFGTVDTWLMANLCQDAPHLTDTTNASRTLLMDIRTGAWSNDLLNIFNVPPSLLPEIQASASDFGVLKQEVLGHSIPLRAICGDQQSSHYAAATLARVRGPMTKITYGTGVFISQSLGKKIAYADHFFTTIVPSQKGIAYALEAKVCVSGPEVEKRLKHPQELKRYFYTLAKRVNTYIDQLPKRPSKLVIDGGSSRDGLILAIQEEISGIPTEPLLSYDGTALGTAAIQIVDR